MKLKTFTIALFCCGAGFLNGSCDKEEDLIMLDSREIKASLNGRAVNDFSLKPSSITTGIKALSAPDLHCSLQHQLLMALKNKAIEPSECAPTPLDDAIIPYYMEFGELEWEWYDLLSTINQLYTFLDDSEQYFGKEGRMTNFAAKHKRNLESFWNMPGEITLKGQHNSTLQNRDAIAAVYVNFAGVPEEIAYEYADFLIEEVINKSEVFGDTPLLSFDGFATTGDLIVIGDGIIQVMSEAGVDEKVTFAGILGHEWGHQIQFNNFMEWYGVDREDQVQSPESTRLIELEADFLTGYYLTHKRGGTYNWKRAEEFFNLFYNIGDCYFEYNGHHGTPNQRLAASRLGYQVAQETFPKGQILEPDELHAIFMSSYSDIINNPVVVAVN